MKQKMRQVLFCLVMVLGIIGLAGCSSKKKTQIDANVESQITSYVNQMMSQLESADDNTLTSAIKQYEDSDDATQVAFGTALQNWVDNKEIIGKISGDPADVKIKEGDNKGYDVKFKLTGEKRNASVSLGLSKKLELTSLSFNPVYSVVEKMEKAFMNLLMGMGTVFVILIFISWLISLFKYINVFEAKVKATKEVKVEQVEEAVVTESTIQESEPELSDDLELVAVITAAIAAYTGNSTDGLVVRSIKRVSKKRR